jgi:hypothetical protein
VLQLPFSTATVGAPTGMPGTPPGGAGTAVAPEKFGAFLARVVGLGGITETPFIQDMGHALVMHEGIKASDWSANPSMIQVAFLENKLNATDLDFKDYETDAGTYNDGDDEVNKSNWWKQVGMPRAADIAASWKKGKDGPAPPSRVPVKFSAGMAAGQILSSSEISVFIAHANFNKLRDYGSKGDWPSSRALLDTNDEWGRLAWRAVTLFSANENMEVHKNDHERMTANEVLKDVCRARGTSVDELILNELYSAREVPRPLADRITRTLIKFTDEAPPNWSALILEARVVERAISLWKTISYHALENARWLLDI